ncbi:MAG: MFS transporter [Edaphobacter sp.]|uniref:MFS transporter n=1 Tax=Edaphobacter sp. TaxID=1934404 RepID=UPI002388ED60|nr:MFS transporter [Edaphobacter sp.]MDE1177329.1 MFS transporter [Edaphobacter sp.]
MNSGSFNPNVPAEETVSATAETPAAVNLRKRWLLLLPTIFVTYSLAYLDRANFGFGAAAGLADTLHITGPETSLLGALFFLGYFTFQIPGAKIAERHSVRWLVFGALVTWGSLAALTGVIRHFWLLALVRFLLGVAESVIFPAILLLLTRWFTRAERSRANSIFILGNPVTVLWMSAITGYLIQGFGWQMTFVLEGLPALLWAPVWLSQVRDRPAAAAWLSDEAKRELEATLEREQIAVGRGNTSRNPLLRRDVLLLSVQYFCWSIGVYGFVLWLPTIVHKGSELSMGQTGLLAGIPYMFAIVLMIVVSSISDRTQKREQMVWPLLLLAGVAMMGSFVFAQRSFVASFVCLVLAGGCMYAPYGPFFAIVPERVPREEAGVALAIINSSGALGAFAGSYLVGLLQSLTGDSRAGFLLMATALIASALLLFLLPKKIAGEPLKA